MRKQPLMAKQWSKENLIPKNDKSKMENGNIPSSRLFHPNCTNLVT